MQYSCKSKNCLTFEVLVSTSERLVAFKLKCPMPLLDSMLSMDSSSCINNVLTVHLLLWSNTYLLIQSPLFHLESLDCSLLCSLGHIHIFCSIFFTVR